MAREAAISDPTWFSKSVGFKSADINHISHLAKSSRKTFGLRRQVGEKKTNLIAMTARQTFYLSPFRICFVRFLIWGRQSFCSSLNTKKNLPSCFNRKSRLLRAFSSFTDDQCTAGSCGLSSFVIVFFCAALVEISLQQRLPAFIIADGSHNDVTSWPGAFQRGCGQIFQTLNLAARLSVAFSHLSASLTRRDAR